MANKIRPAGRRSQAESVRTRARILNRAERLFARRGYRGVSVRAVAAAAGVSPFTIQHHFRSKLGLYQAVLDRWDGEVEALLSRAVDQGDDLTSVVETLVDDLFDFLLARRDWVTVTTRAGLGEGLPKGISLNEQGWIRSIDRAMRRRGFGSLKLDLGLLLISVEGMMHHHVLSDSHYRELFGKPVTDSRVRLRTKRHLKKAILALVDVAP